MIIYTQVNFLSLVFKVMFIEMLSKLIYFSLYLIRYFVQRNPVKLNYLRLKLPLFLSTEEVRILY